MIAGRWLAWSQWCTAAWSRTFSGWSSSRPGAGQPVSCCRRARCSSNVRVNDCTRAFVPLSLDRTDAAQTMPGGGDGPHQSP